jgi:endonuclease V-like protein UPF0215 family
VLGVDDGPFSFSDATVPVIGLVARKGYVDAVLKTQVDVDGSDATCAIASLVGGTGYTGKLEAVMLDGAVVGGFNVVDIEELNRMTGVPVITVTSDRPDMAAIRRALEMLGRTPKYGRCPLPDWKERLALLERTRLVEVATSHKPVQVGFAGIDEPDAKGIVTASTIRGSIPEPLRLAHLIARAYVTGRSKGKSLCPRGRPGQT